MALRYKVLGHDDRPLKDAKKADLVFDTEAEACAERDKEVGRRVVFCDDEGKVMKSAVDLVIG